MMQNQPLELGAVYQPAWDQHPIRVIAFDANVVMYDAWWPHLGAWGFSKSIPSRTIYYRLCTDFLLKRAAYVRTEEYTDEERAIHRPDLPLALLQSEAISWYDDVPASASEVADLLAGSKLNEDNLRASPICLCPFGPKDSLKKGMTVEARNGAAFSAEELLFEAWRLQAPYLRESLLTNGVGLYRLGVERRVPSYTMWGARSRLEDSLATA